MAQGGLLIVSRHWSGSNNRKYAYSSVCRFKPGAAGVLFERNGKENQD